jgi:polyisoprenoid-binding protein YceI
MKKHIFSLLALSALVFIGCKNEPTADAATSTNSELVEATTPTPGQMEEISTLAKSDALTLSVNTAASFIEWTGSSANGSHHGTIKLLNGGLNIIRGNLKRSSFELDMNSIAVSDLEGEKKADLEGHLKNNDFFDVGKFPVGTFEIRGINLPVDQNADYSYDIKGRLTLKGIAKEVEFPITIGVKDGNVTVTSPEFSINRTEWDVKYKSGILGTIKDEIINDDVKLKINLVAPLPNVQ